MIRCVDLYFLVWSQDMLGPSTLPQAPRPAPVESPSIPDPKRKAKDNIQRCLVDVLGCQALAKGPELFTYIHLQSFTVPLYTATIFDSLYSII